MRNSRSQNRGSRHLYSLGFADAEPLRSDTAHGPVPDAAELNLNALLAIAVTGVVSFLIMAGAIHVAFDGEDTFSTSSQVYFSIRDAEPSRTASGKTDRARTTVHTSPNRREFTVSLAESSGRLAQLRNQAFEWISVPLATSATVLTADIPRFGQIERTAGTPSDDSHTVNVVSQIYGEAVESDVVIASVPMNLAAPPPRNVSDASAVQFLLRGEPLQADQQPATALAYAPLPDLRSTPRPVASSVPENVSVIAKRKATPGTAERVVKLEVPRPLLQILDQNGFPPGASAQIVDASRNVLGITELPALTRLRILYRTGVSAEESSPVRLSVYLHDDQSNTDKHSFTVAMTDSGRFVLALEPPRISFAEESTERVDVGALPSLYRSIWETLMRNDVPDDVVAHLVKLLSEDVDLRETVSPGDGLEILRTSGAGDHGDVLYVSLRRGGGNLELFRFVDRSGRIGFYDRKGTAGGTLLLRRPLEGGGILTSPMGMRTHPVTGRRLGHEGVDLAAAKGTPVYAAGDGVVTAAGWNGGYGRQVRLSHTNGYETSYSHMSRIADGMTQGVEVEQGQIIGYVGTTGLSTGNHLHYEMTVNDRLVDALSVQLPPRQAVPPSEMQDFVDVVGSIEKLLEAETARGSRTVVSSR